VRKFLIVLLIALTLLSGCRYQVVENASHVRVTGP
jgi:hypothetical protein